MAKREYCYNNDILRRQCLFSLSLFHFFSLYTSPSFVVYKSVDATSAVTLTIIIAIAATTITTAKRKRFVSVPLKMLCTVHVKLFESKHSALMYRAKMHIYIYTYKDTSTHTCIYLIRMKTTTIVPLIHLFKIILLFQVICFLVRWLRFRYRRVFKSFHSFIQIKSKKIHLAFKPEKNGKTKQKKMIWSHIFQIL